MRIIVLVLVLLMGCTTEAVRDEKTGSLKCVGFCELNVDNRNHSVKTTEPDGKVVKEKNRATGLNPDQAAVEKDPDDSEQ